MSHNPLCINNSFLLQEMIAEIKYNPGVDLPYNFVDFAYWLEEVRFSSSKYSARHVEEQITVISNPHTGD